MTHVWLMGSLQWLTCECDKCSFWTCGQHGWCGWNFFVNQQTNCQASEFSHNDPQLTFWVIVTAEMCAHAFFKIQDFWWPFGTLAGSHFENDCFFGNVCDHAVTMTLWLLKTIWVEPSDCMEAFGVIFQGLWPLRSQDLRSCAIELVKKILLWWWVVETKRVIHSVIIFVQVLCVFVSKFCVLKPPKTPKKPILANLGLFWMGIVADVIPRDMCEKFGGSIFQFGWSQPKNHTQHTHTPFAPAFGSKPAEQVKQLQLFMNHMREVMMKLLEWCLMMCDNMSWPIHASMTMFVTLARGFCWFQLAHPVPMGPAGWKLSTSVHLHHIHKMCCTKIEAPDHFFGIHLSNLSLNGCHSTHRCFFAQLQNQNCALGPFCVQNEQSKTKVFQDRSLHKHFIPWPIRTWRSQSKKENWKKWVTSASKSGFWGHFWDSQGHFLNSSNCDHLQWPNSFKSWIFFSFMSQQSWWPITHAKWLGLSAWLGGTWLQGHFWPQWPSQTQSPRFHTHKNSLMFWFWWWHIHQKKLNCDDTIFAKVVWVCVFWFFPLVNDQNFSGLTMHEGWVPFIQIMAIFLGHRKSSKMSLDSLVLVWSKSSHTGLWIMLFAPSKMTKFQQHNKTPKSGHISSTHHPLFEGSTRLQNEPSLVDIHGVKVRLHGFLCFAHWTLKNDQIWKVQHTIKNWPPQLNPHQIFGPSPGLRNEPSLVGIGWVQICESADNKTVLGALWQSGEDRCRKEPGCGCEETKSQSLRQFPSADFPVVRAKKWIAAAKTIPLCGFPSSKGINGWVKKRKKEYNTRDSNVVPHRSTNRARACLTSLSRREAVLSCWYGRTRTLEVFAAS